VPRLRVTDDKGAVATDSVQVDVSAGPELSVTPTVLQLGADETTGSFTVFNNGGGDLTWSVSESEDWIVGLDPATGTNSGSVTVTVDRSGLGGGDYAGTVSVSSNGGSATVQVQLGGAGTYPKHWNIDSRVFDVEIAPDGTVWVSDWDADGVRVFDSGGTEQRFIGGSGSADGQFDGLTRIAFDANDQAYVGDHYNYRVQVFDLAGQFLRKWGSQGTASGAQFETVWSVAIPSGGDVYVLEDANHRIQRFQSDGTYVSAFGDTDYNQPKGMAIDSSGNFYVADKGNHRIRKLGPDGTSISEWGSKGSGDGQLDEPYDVAVDSSDRIYVADLRNNRIQVFDSTGDFLWSSEADYPGLLNLPAGVEVSSAGEVFVAEYGGRRVTVLGPLD
jgi:streptogramin lyase